MHFKTWFIFQMEKHCFQRPLLGSSQFPDFPFQENWFVCGCWEGQVMGFSFWEVDTGRSDPQLNSPLCSNSFDEEKSVN